jgi:putative MFS transporter
VSASAFAPGRVLGGAVVVAALGYFVDIYDLVLFSIVRVPSLTALGVTGPALVEEGVRLLNLQMVGMLLGGIAWGVVGDRLGRLQILFGSIVTYSLATLANAYVGSLEAYGWLRFVAGFGLAGELGAGITLVAESLPASRRGWGTMLVATVGVSGAILANAVASHLDWRGAYKVGGALGLLLLLLRVSVSESQLFKKASGSGAARGNFFALFARRERLARYVRSILIGTPTWFIVGVLITFAPEFARSMGVKGAVTAGNAVMACYLGLVFGDLASGLLSQVLRSRKRVVLLFLALTTGAVAAYFVIPPAASPAVFYGVCVGLGFAAGYWAIFVTIAAEQFGTNLRATVATTVPNFVRGMVPPITAAFLWARDAAGLVPGALAVGGVCVAVAVVAALGLQETFGKDLDWIEE